ncbi:MAG: hypothetical protein AAGA68_17620 [Pseudomonadota bacterium]
MVRIAARLVQPTQGAVVVAHEERGEGAVGVEGPELRVAGAQGDGPLEAGDRLLVSSAVGEGVAQGAVGHGESWAEFD